MLQPGNSTHRHEKTKNMAVCQKKTLFSLSISSVWSLSLLSVRRYLGSLVTHWAHRGDFYQIGRIPRLNWVFSHTHFVGFVISWLNYIRAATHDFQQYGILTSLDSHNPVQPPIKLRASKRCSVSSLTLLEYSSVKQRIWSNWAYAQADLRLCLSHIPNCWKSHVLAQYYAFST